MTREWSSQQSGAGMRWTVIVVLGLCAVGCTKTSKHDVAVFELAPGKISQPAPVSAKYTVKIARPGADDFDRIPATQIRVERGTAMGFESTPDGLVAFAGDERICLDVPAGATVKWQAKTKKHTQLATNMRRVGQYSAWGAAGVGAALMDSAVDNAIDRAIGVSNSRRDSNPSSKRCDDKDFHLFRDVWGGALENATQK